MSYAKRSRLHDFETSSELCFLEKQILKYLSDHSSNENSQHETLRIAQGIGKKNKKDINPCMYSLQRKGFIEKVNTSPPKWRLLREKGYLNPHGAAPSTHVLQPHPSQPPSFTPTNFTHDDFKCDFESQEPRNVSAEYQKTPNVQGETPNSVIPPSPAQLLNDPTSLFCRFNLQESFRGEQRAVEESIMTHLANNNTSVEINDIQKFSDASFEAINKAVKNLLEQKRVVKIGGKISLMLLNDQLMNAENTPIVNYPTSAKIFGPSPHDFGSPVQNLHIPEGKNAISVLNEYAQARKMVLDYKESMSGPDHQRIFHIMAVMGGRTFRTANAKSKKEAKLKAAEMALSELRQEGGMQSTLAGNVPMAQGNTQGTTIHDRIESLVCQKYNHLVQQLPDVMTGRKIFAGFVISKPDDVSGKTMEVISIGSGNRCVAGDKLSLRGATVNDCHAEIIARRGLVRYLYGQIITFFRSPQTNTIFVSVNNRLLIKPGIEFHLYISTAPCGDSAIFAPSDSSTDAPYQNPHDSMHHPIFENKKQGLLRTKVENGEGCIPIEEGTSQPTWDGLLRGERLRTMSCSDKIAKWNILGLQGALLTHFMDPIYMSTLTLGMLYNHRHLTRAVCCRVEKFLTEAQGGNLPDGYQVHHPMVNGQQNQNRETGKIKTREFSLNWSLGDVKAEVLDGTQGKCEDRFGSTNPPQLCKAELYKLFQEVCKITKGECKASYYQSKMAAMSYQQAKNIFVASFEKCGFGKWMPKPKEEKDF